MSDWRTTLGKALGEQVTFDEPLARRVAFRIGGPADALVRPRTAEALARTLRIARSQNVPLTVLGSGSNVLIADRGIRGITIRLAGSLTDWGFSPADDSGRLTAQVGAGALNAPLVAAALDVGVAGIEFLATIPGTLGGALIMNAGAHGGELGQFVQTVTLIDDDLQVVTRSGAECGFVYRSSGFGRGEILTNAELHLQTGDVAAARARLQEIRQWRRATQPIKAPNAGSIFKNPPGEYAGRLIEACDFKGRRIGGAQISEVHANFIVNNGGATAADVIALAAEVRRGVHARYGIELEWEVKQLGDHLAPDG